jgi:hypothetical protein
MRLVTRTVAALLLLAALYAQTARGSDRTVIAQNEYGWVSREYNKFDDETTIGLHLNLEGERFYIFGYTYFKSRSIRPTGKLTLHFKLASTSFDSDNLIVLVNGQRQKYPCNDNQGNFNCHDIPIEALASWINAGSVEGRAGFKEFTLRPEHMALLRAYLSEIGEI